MPNDLAGTNTCKRKRPRRINNKSLHHGHPMPYHRCRQVLRYAGTLTGSKGFTDGDDGSGSGIDRCGPSGALTGLSSGITVWRRTGSPMLAIALAPLLETCDELFEALRHSVAPR